MEAGMRIGVAGLGRMGAAMAARLIDRGHELVVWNRSAERAAPLLAAGAKAAASPASLADAADLVVTMLFDQAAVESVYRGPAGLLSGKVAGKLLIDMSTVRPSEAQATAKEARAAGAVFVECPVAGTIAPARNGQLLGFAGGEPADFARAKSVLEELCRRVDLVGSVGAGAAMKLAINLPLLVFWHAFGEANALIRDLGCDPQFIVGLFGESAGGPNVLRARAAAVAGALADKGTGEVTFTIGLIAKDLRLMVDEAAAKGFDLPVVQRTLEVCEQMLKNGWAERDCAWIPAFWPAHVAGKA
jgi:3-hydroxyisobutyrate dehydrogenase